MTPTEPIRAPLMSIPMVVFGSGWVGLMGWLSLCLLLLLALYVVANGVTRRTAALPGVFFGCAHVQALLFTLCNGVCGIKSLFYCCCGGLDVFTFALGQTIFAFSVGIGLTLISVLAVALVTRQRPGLPFWSWIGFGILAVDIGMLVAGPMVLVSGMK